MGDTMIVNFAALHQASADISRALGSIESQLGALEQAAAPLVQTWDGEARHAYELRHRTWRTAAEELARTLREIRVAVDESAADYAATERRATRLFE